MKILEKLKMKIWKLVEDLAPGEDVHVYIPSVGKCYKMTCSSVKKNTFTARWVGEEPDEVNLMKSYRTDRQ